MAIIRTATPEPWVRPSLTNVVITNMTAATIVQPRFLNATRTLIYGTRGNLLVKSSDDGTTWTTVRDFGTPAAGAWLLPNGEALVATKPGGNKGQLMLSTGFAANDTTATWASVLTCSRNDNYIHPAWGLSMAPAGHPRAGIVVATEYGVQGAAGDSDDITSKAWLSSNYGQSWRQIFNLSTVGRANVHMHGIVYDPWDDRPVISVCDGNAGQSSYSGVLVSNNWQDQTPSWSWVLGPFTTASFQLTTMYPTPSGIIAAGDGFPPGLYRLPRRGYRDIGATQVVMNWGGGTDAGFIGQQIYQHSPGQIILMGKEYTKASPFLPITIDGSIDGTTFFELWRDATGAGIAQYTLSNPIGPTMTGKVCAAIKDYRTATTTWKWLTGELVNPGT